MLQYWIFLSLAPIAAAMVILIAGYAWLRPGSPLARSLAWYLLAVAGFLSANILELIEGTPDGAAFFARVEYLFIPLIPVLWLRFALFYIGRADWASPRRMWLFAILPVMTALLAWSNSLHGLVWAQHTYNALGESWGTFLVQRYGPWFWAQGVYSYILLLGGVLLIMLEALRAPRLFRMQSLSIMVGALLPLIFNLVYVFRVIPGLVKDYTPLAFALAGLAFALSIFRHRLLAISPVARAVLIESMQDPMLVLDELQRVIDMNPAAQRFLGIAAEASLGQPFKQVWPAAANITPLTPDATVPLGWAGAQHLAQRIPPIITVTDHSEPGEAVLRSYELHISPLPTRGHAASRIPAAGRIPSPSAGWLVVLHDLTLRRQAEVALEEANHSLADAYREVAEKSNALAKTNAAMVTANNSLLHLNEELEARVSARTESLRQRAAELEVLAHVSSALRQTATFDELLATLLRETGVALGFGAGAILLHEEDFLRVAALHNQPPDLFDTMLAPDGGPLWQALHSGQTTRVDLRTSPAGLSPSLIILANDYPSGILAPMQVPGRTLGLLAFFFDPRNEPSQEWPLTAIAEMGANAIQRVRLMETLEQLVWDRTRDLSTLYEVTSTTNEFQDLDTLLVRILEKALDVLHGRIGLVHLLVERPDPRYTLADQPRPPETALRLITTLGLDTLPSAQPAPTPHLLGRDHPGPWSEVFERNNILVLPDVTEQPLPAAARIEQGTAPDPADHPNNSPSLEPVQANQPNRMLPPQLLAILCEQSAVAYVGVPIHAKGRALGVMSVFGESLASFSAEDIALLAAIADHVGGAVENAQLRKKAEDAAVMEERQRLARDLHDSVTQSLYSLVLFSQAGRDALAPAVLAEDGETDTVGASLNVARALTLLSRVGETSQQALKELRLLIYELRPLALPTDGLTGALRNRLETVEQRAGVRPMLLAEHAGDLPPEIESGLYGIAQEALNNVVKHARANEVTVRFEVWPERVELEISDNGRGFLIDPVHPGGGIGLASMRERAAAMGGTLAVRSEIERGTSILVSLKREEPDDERYRN